MRNNTGGFPVSLTWARKALGELDPIDRLRDLRDKPHSRAVLDENRPASALDNTPERLPMVAHKSDLHLVPGIDVRDLGFRWFCSCFAKSVP
jgi:hypothetical protein